MAPDAGAVALEDGTAAEPLLRRRQPRGKDYLLSEDASDESPASDHFSWLHLVLQRLYRRHGENCAQHAGAVILGGVLVIGVCLLGECDMLTCINWLQFKTHALQIDFKCIVLVVNVWL